MKVQLEGSVRVCASQLCELASLATDHAMAVTVVVVVLATAGWTLKRQRLERDELRRSLAEMRQRAEEERDARMCAVCLDRD